MRPTTEPEVLVSGRRLGLSLTAAIGSAAGVGIFTWYVLERTSGRLLGTALPQTVTFAVYAALVAVLCYAFRPPNRPPIALRFTGVTDLLFAIGATIALMAACALAYACLGRFLGGFAHLLAQLTAVATDARRLQGQSSSAWAIAILRGCLLVPIFEEVFFRGLLLLWLNRHMRFVPALLVQATLFAAMHLYPVALPYAFLFGTAAGCVRRATGSTFNTVLMHVMNNVILLTLGLHWFGR
ncbi:MAG TPA: CPBP family intramembrane glutamic endopeptidase [Acidobacteriaceae bacterium]|nr:CPBP family intramembrane glutamic endopeptidase [Acidobacteriaceae bacterium]